MNITDGTTQWKPRDKREIALFDLLYPVGIIVSTTTATIPFELGEWEEVGQGRVLQGAGEGQIAGETVEAGLPNITGNTGELMLDVWATGTKINGAFTNNYSGHGMHPSTEKDGKNLFFDASKSNPIYGASETVQPPAYLVHFYRRTA